MSLSEFDALMRTWEWEAQKTIALLKALPKDKYDFRPDPGSRSMGELAWHLAEADAYMTVGVENGKFDFSQKPPGIERPKTVEELAPGYERVHKDAVARIRKLGPAVLEKPVDFLLPGEDWNGSRILWSAMIYHNIHHRGQLSVLCRLAGGTCPGIYGPNREDTEAMKAAQAAK